MNLRFSLGGTCALLAACAFACSSNPDDFGTAPGFGTGGSSGVVGSTAISTGGSVNGACPAPVAFHAAVVRDGVALRSDGNGPDGGLGDSTWSVSGVFTDLGNGQFLVDACGVTPCMPAEVYEITVTTLGSMTAPPTGAYVELTYLTADGGFGVDDPFAITITNLPMLDGSPNPLDTSTAIWFEGMHGLVEAAPFVPSFTLANTCYTNNASLGHDLYVMLGSDPLDRVRVPMGESMTWEPLSGPFASQYVVTDLTSLALDEERFVDFVVRRFQFGT